MSRDAPDVFHDSGGILENGGVETLQNKPAVRAARLKRAAVSIVDVAAAERFGVEKVPGQLKLAGDGADIGWQIHAANFSASVTAVAVSAATAATAATTAGFFARVGVIAGAGGREGGKFLVEPRGAAVRAFGAAPLGGADENLGIVFALGAMKFVDWHGAKIVREEGMFKRGCATANGGRPPGHHQGRAPLSFFLASGSFSRALPARTSMRNGGSISGGSGAGGGAGSDSAGPASTILPMTASSSARP